MRSRGSGQTGPPEVVLRMTMLKPYSHSIARFLSYTFSESKGYIAESKPERLEEGNWLIVIP